MIRSVSRKAILALPLAALTLAMSTAFAATVGPAGPAFYDAPSPLPEGAHGDLISYRPATVKLGADAPSVKAWNVMYLSQDADEYAQVATGTVMVPAAPWTGAGERPVVLYAVGTHGLGQDCAASKQLEKGTDYETINIAAALKAGYAVLVSDYVGYTTGGLPHYMAGPSQGRNVLDMFKASMAVPGTGMSASAKTAIWGFSQGGQSSAFASELQPTYAPEMNVVGAAMGGVPGDLVATSRYLNGRNGASFLFQAILGLTEEYPTGIPFNLAISQSGRATMETLKTECVFKALFKYQNQSIESYTNPGFTLDKMMGLPSVKAVMAEQSLGKTKVNFPIYQFHGQADEFIELNQAIALKKRYCALGTDVTFDMYPSEHVATLFQAAPYVLTWLADRFAGLPAQGTCANNAPEPQTTAIDNSGDLRVALTKWPLSAKVNLPRARQSVSMPQGSVFTAETNITQGTMRGQLSVPNFSQPLKLIGTSARLGLKIEPAGDTVGSATLDDEGILHLRGVSPVNIAVTSQGGVDFGECKTVSPVQFPLNFDGPISSLGAGKVIFNGTTSFPRMAGCSIAPMISVFTSGPGQEFTFKVEPPAPVRY